MMSFDQYLYWKNFNLGKELHIVGTYVYNSIYCWEKIEYIYHEHEIFEFLYNISIGIERLEKITLVLIEHEPSLNQEEFEKSLITHNHLDLLHRIKKNRAINLGDVHVRFLSVLTEFYRTARYDRFNLASILGESKDKIGLAEFIKSNFNVSEEGLVPMVVNTEKIRKGIERIIKKIVLEIYRILQEETSRLQIFTDDILFASKAYKIFMERDFSFERERFLQKEILVSLLNTNDENSLIKYIKKIYPLPLESYTTTEYINFLFDIRNQREIVDELDSILEDIPKDRDRFNAVNAIGSEIFDNFDEEDFS